MKILIPPSTAGYAAERGSEVLSVKLDGGASKYRRDIIGAAFNVNVTWDGLNAEQFNYLNACFRTGTVRGSLPFDIDLILDKSALTEYSAYFVPGSFKLTAQQGLAYFVSAQLE